MLGGVVVGTQLGIEATVFYLLVYLAMNLAAFAVIWPRVSESPPTATRSPRSPVSARAARRWPCRLTVAMLALAGIPATVGFIGKFYLIRALVDGNYTWLGIVIVIGSMLSLGYYLRVVATIWMGSAEGVPAAAAAAATPGPGGLPAIAGASPEADSPPASDPTERDPSPDHPEAVVVAVLFGAAIIFFGIFPSPLFDLVGHAGHAIGGIF